MFSLWSGYDWNRYLTCWKPFAQLRMRSTDNGWKVNPSETDASGGPETRLPVGVALVTADSAEIYEHEWFWALTREITAR